MIELTMEQARWFRLALGRSQVQWRYGSMDSDGTFLFEAESTDMQSLLHILTDAIEEALESGGTNADTVTLRFDGPRDLSRLFISKVEELTLAQAKNASISKSIYNAVFATKAPLSPSTQRLVRKKQP